MLVTDEHFGAALQRLLKVDVPVRSARQGDWVMVLASKLLSRPSPPPPLPPRARLLVVMDSRTDKKSAKLVRWVTAMVPSAFAADPETARRLVEAARVPGAAPHLIAHAELQGTDLVVTTCDLEALRVPISKLPALRDLGPRQVTHFEVEGGGLRWPAHDIDIGLDGMRQAIDSKAKAAAVAKTHDHNARYGAAIRAEREAAGLGQGQVPGLSPRTLHRIEHGKQNHVRVATLDKLAKAHRVTTADYLDRLAKRMGANT